MGVDAEVSRSRTYPLHAVGSKIHTHTIDFVTDTSSELTYFEDSKLNIAIVPPIKRISNTDAKRLYQNIAAPITFVPLCTAQSSTRF